MRFEDDETLQSSSDKERAPNKLQPAKWSFSATRWSDSLCIHNILRECARGVLHITSKMHDMLVLRFHAVILSFSEPGALNSSMQDFVFIFQIPCEVFRALNWSGGLITSSQGIWRILEDYKMPTVWICLTHIPSSKIFQICELYRVFHVCFLQLGEARLVL